MARSPHSTVHVVLIYATIAVILRPVWPVINNPLSIVTWRGTRCHHTKQECSEWVDSYWHLRCPARCNCRGHRHGECIQSTSCNSLHPYKCKCLGGYNSKTKKNSPK